MFDQKTLHGTYFALAAYLFWGVSPIYFKWIDHVSAWEILSHRVIWALILLLAILTYTGDLARLKVPLRTLPKILLTATLLCFNWLVFIFAILNDKITEASLGYFINPLVTLFLGVIFLKEHMRPLQWIAVTIAALGILLQLLLFGAIPWLALALAFTFGFYGLFRKNLNLHAVAGLAIETAMIVPFALAYLLWFSAQGTLTFGEDHGTDGLLMLGGFVTAFPLLCFSAAVTRLSLSTIGLIQYISPSMSLVVAIFLYGEPFDISQMISFGFIWVALIVFSTETWHHQRNTQRFSLS